MIYGAIDIGTNAARLLVGEVVIEEKTTFIRKVSYTRIPLRLGYDVFENGEISPEKEVDFIKTLQSFKLIAEVFKVRGLRACATSAMREAKNGVEIQKRILEETGINLEIIDGDEEARMIFGTFSLLNINKDVAYVVIDVGGGSSEVTLFDNGVKVAEKSFKVGTIRMLKEKTSEKVWNEIEDWITENTNPKYTYRIYGTGGNINKCHKLLGKQLDEPISYRELDELFDNLSKLTVTKRMFKYQLKEDRADVIVPALQIFKHIMRSMKAKEIMVPKIGLVDGLIFDQYAHEMKEE
jgi:exopolyphosphatase/guanosine-5'-triphosphate,3'-diphosphate pyrophosphatase